MEGGEGCGKWMLRRKGAREREQVFYFIFFITYLFIYLKIIIKYIYI